MDTARVQTVVVAASMLLFGLGVGRAFSPQEPRLRALSVEAIDVPSAVVGQGETATNETKWSPPDDVFVVGWSPWVGAPESGGELVLSSGSTRLFVVFSSRATGQPQPTFPSGTGFMLRREQALTLRYRVLNTGPAGETRGAGALVYFVPAVAR